MQPESPEVPTRELAPEKQGKDYQEGGEVSGHSYCALHPTPRRVFGPGVTAAREDLAERADRHRVQGSRRAGRRDDSGEDTNAYFRYKLIKGRKYVLRIRLYYSDRPGQTAVMMW
jgi:hypothetical protein